MSSVSNRKPNVVFIISDDHRYEAMRNAGNPVVQTPVLDSLSAEGTSFCNTHILGGLTGAVCAPSRACVNTGLSIFRSMIGKDVQVWEHSVVIRPEVKLLPQAMKEAGYTTYAVGKWHNDKASFVRSFTGGDKLFFYGMSDHRKVPVQDFDPQGNYEQDREYVEEMFSTELFTDAAVNFIERYEDEQPFFLYIAYTAPHDPRTAPEPYAGMYDKKDIPVPPNFMPAHPFDNGEMTVRDEKLARLPREEDEVRQHVADYYAMITHMDEQIGRLLEALKASGEIENTIIVYTADHGLAIGQHGLMGKQNVYDHSIRIPLIFWGPGVKEGQRVHGLSSNIDIFPTLAELAGVPVPRQDGVSLLSLIRGEKRTARETVCTVYRDVQRMAKDDRWKLIRYYHSPITNTGTDRIQMFDLQEDPWETTDLSAESAYKEHKERLAGELLEWMKENDDILKDRPVLL